ncbi:sulfurtransferase [Nocardia gamkensis]|uniref:thiosulfate sulfurtransferase n=1 Tax=Nocardia gamkensis TaxID=352869 RepID=A0A7X6R254_9NOCA|nr:rhodanese-like domain-containing protein [Nocardia gamkensis]NKY25990.1 sulfurtransferase [Nocardia gamkensis]NQE71447.1 putative thiosulfate sulfurtransferase SseB [Nocardia gamkensis]
MSGARAAHLISASNLRDDPPEQLVLLDVRVGAGVPDPNAFRRGHLPGARFVDVDADLAATATARSGARPLPEAGPLTTALRSWGIRADSTVVVYDDSRSVPAARAWWVLRWAGLTDVRLLDGGLRAWRAAGGPIVSGTETVTAGTVSARPGGLPVVGTAAVATLPARGILLDARPRSHYRGEGAFAGHIPDAVNAPVFDDFDEHGLLRDEHTLRTRYRGLGLGLGPATPAATHCGSGMAAALQVFVLTTLGIEIALYPGSLSQWTADPARPLVRGDSPAPGPVPSP